MPGPKKQPARQKGEKPSEQREASIKPPEQQCPPPGPGSRMASGKGNASPGQANRTGGATGGVDKKPGRRTQK